MNKPARLVAAFGLAFGFLIVRGEAKDALACPDPIKDAEKLILVLGPSMASHTANVQLFARGKDGRWMSNGAPRPATLGAGGLAWSWAYKHLAADGEAIKKEGDGRTPAGFFGVGKAFGFSPRRGGDYVRLEKAQHYCVDDPDSPHYNSVIPRSQAGAAKGGEDMATIAQYRAGLFLDYPTNRAVKGGSCIFLHVWRGPEAPTSGCVALPERRVAALQLWAKGARTVIGILPKAAWPDLRSCFPGL